MGRLYFINRRAFKKKFSNKFTVSTTFVFGVEKKPIESKYSESSQSNVKEQVVVPFQSSKEMKC